MENGIEQQMFAPILTAMHVVKVPARNTLLWIQYRISYLLKPVSFHIIAPYPEV